MSSGKGDAIETVKVVSLEALRRLNRWENRLSIESVQEKNPAPTHNLLDHFSDVLKHCGDAHEIAVAVVLVLEVIVNSGSAKTRSIKELGWALRKKGVSQSLFTALQVIVRKQSIIREEARIYELVKKERIENNWGLSGPKRVKNEEHNAFCVVAQQQGMNNRKVINSYRRSRRRVIRRMAGHFEL